MARHGMLWYSTVYGGIRYDTAGHDTPWSDTARYDVTVCSSIEDVKYYQLPRDIFHTCTCV